MARKATSKGWKKSGSKNSSAGGAGDAFIKLLQSPLVAELVAVAATAALASLAETGVSSDGGAGKRAGRAVKRAGKAAAAPSGGGSATRSTRSRKRPKPLSAAQKRKPGAAHFAHGFSGQAGRINLFITAGLDAQPAAGREPARFDDGPGDGGSRDAAHKAGRRKSGRTVWTGAGRARTR